MSVKNKINNLNLWIREKTSLDAEIVTIKKFQVGQSNPTYLLKSNSKSFVLRSKPLGNLLPGAHRIDREYRVMSALSMSKLPVPKIYGYCNDINIFDSEFYIMEFLDGTHEFDPILPNYSAKQRGQIYKHKTEILADLAMVDLAELKLEDFGRIGSNS